MIKGMQTACPQELWLELFAGLPMMTYIPNKPPGLYLCFLVSTEQRLVLKVADVDQTKPNTCCVHRWKMRQYCYTCAATC